MTVRRVAGRRGRGLPTTVVPLPPTPKTSTHPAPDRGTDQHPTLDHEMLFTHAMEGFHYP